MKSMRIRKSARLNLRCLFISLLIIILSISFVSAYQRLCLGYGQSVPSDENPRYTCWHDLCQICVNDNLYPARPSRCNGISGCSTLGNSTIDQDPPNLTINSPVDFGVFNSRRVLFDIRSDEPASLYYIDNVNGRGRWRRLSSRTQHYSKSLSFKDGLNNITIRGKDKKGNVIEVIRQFYVDSKKPKIRRTYPRKGFVGSEFEVQFVEENPSQLVLHYGNELVGMREFELDLGEDCSEERRRQICSSGEIDLSDYDGQEIEYWFELEDIAGVSVESRHIWLSVDVSAPDLLNPDSFWLQGEGRYSRYIYFNMEIDEENFDEVNYIDWNDRRPRWRRLCSRLRDGKCVTRKSFRKGSHVLDIQIMDESGNAVGKRVEFVV